MECGMRRKRYSEDKYEEYISLFGKLLLQTMFSQFLRKSGLIRNSGFLEKRAEKMISEIEGYLKKNDRILDIGCGGCHVAKRLQEKGYSVVPLDIENQSSFQEIMPVIYDGKTIPFADDSFGVTLLLTVLHHTQDPVHILTEAKRVSRRIVIIEDLYDGWFQKYLTFVMDSVVNFECIGHPHSNKTKKEWETDFRALNLRISDERSHQFWMFFTSGIFYLEKG